MSGASSLEGIDAAQDPRKFLEAASKLVGAAPKKQIPDNLKPVKKDWYAIANGLVILEPADIAANGAHWSNVMDFIALSTVASASDQKASAVGVATLAQAILRLDPTAGTFTSHHLSLVRASLTVQAYGEARPVLNHSIHSFPAQDTDDSSLSNAYITLKSGTTHPIQVKDIQEYYLSSAMIFIGVREWSRAHSSLEHVLCTPNSNNASAYMLEAYKKWVLVSLLVTGKQASAPKASNAAAVKHLRNLSKQYESIAEAFKSKDPLRLRAEISEAEQEFRQAGNYGLVLNVLRHYRFSAISKLRQTFTTVTISMVARKLGISTADAVAYVQELVQEGALEGTLEQRTPEAIVRFDAEGVRAVTEADERQLQRHLRWRRSQLQDLSAHVNEAVRKLSLTSEYASAIKARRLTAASKQAKASEKTGTTTVDEEAMDISFQEAESDEDDEMTTAEGR